jgi:hypothetical protein
MEKRPTHQEHESVTAESLPRILMEIALWREEKGQSEKVIPYIKKVRGEVEKLGDVTTVIQLHQEEFLAGHHMMMEERDKGPIGNPLRLAKGLLTVKRAISKMEKFLTDAVPESIHKKRIPRFQGRFADMTRQYEKAEKYYRQALKPIESETEIEKRCHMLELKGFIAEATFKQGKEAGLAKVNQVLKDFDESPEGKWLKEHDYYTWAVWKTGIEIRTARQLLRQDSQTAKKLISQAETELISPEGDTHDFGIRLGELAAVRDALSRQWQ